ncbi:MAG: ChaN family lipoprotein [Planctomycetota bacterium]
MYRRFFILSALIVFPACLFAEDEEIATAITPEHYRIYKGNGVEASMEEILAAAKKIDVLFLGEYHDDPVAHHLEKSILEQVHSDRPVKKNGDGTRPLALSMEMFERDTQMILDEYLSDLVTEKYLIKDGRAWKNYESDYKPLVEFAKENQLTVIAANAPRRYVNLVGREGRNALGQLSDQALSLSLPPLPYAEPSPAYANKFHSLMDKFGRDRAKKKGEAFDDSEEAVAKRAADRADSLAAQALWDASMAYSIARQLADEPDSQVLHINGSFHTEKRLGIPEHLQSYRPNTSLLVVTILADDSFPDFDTGTMESSGDFVIVTDNQLPRSYDASARN